VWKCLPARSSLMRLYMMCSGSSTGVISYPISYSLSIIYHFSLSHRFPSVPICTVPRRDPAYTRITLDLTATHKRSPDRVGLDALRSYVPSRWIGGFGWIVWTPSSPQYIIQLVSYFSFPSLPYLASFCEAWLWCLYPLGMRWRLTRPRLGHPQDRG
jgi:hypothetical protein